MSSSRPPALISDDEYDSSSASESESEDSSDEWPAGLKEVLGNRPSAKDYDQHGCFKRTSDYYTNSEEDTKDPIPVSTHDPLEAEEMVNGVEGNKENSGGANKEKAPQKPVPASTSAKQAIPPKAVPKKKILLKVPPVNKDKTIQQANIKTYYTALLDRYQEYDMKDVQAKCQEFRLTTRDEIEVAVNVFYDRAVVGTEHGQPIASLCKCMEVHKIHHMILFRETLLSTCRKKFHQLKGEINALEELTLGKLTDSQDLIPELGNDPDLLARYMEGTEVEDRVTRHMVFFGELYNYKELPIKVVLRSMSKMFETVQSRHLDLLSIKGLRELFIIVGHNIVLELSTECPFDVKDQYKTILSNLESLNKDDTYPARARCVLADILRLRDEGWVGTRTESPVKREAIISAVKSTSAAPVRKPVPDKTPSPPPAPVTARDKSSARTKSKTREKSNARGAGQREKSSARGVSRQSTVGEEASGSRGRTGAKPLDAKAVSFQPGIKQPLLVKPSAHTNAPLSGSEERLQTQIGAHLATALGHVIAGDTNKAINAYKDCLILFDCLPNKHPEMDATLLCMYTMVTEHQKDGMNTHMIPSLYERIAKHVKSGQYVEYIHVCYLSNGNSYGDFAAVLSHFVRLNRAVEEHWTPVYYPLSAKKCLPESERDNLREWMRKFVSQSRQVYKGSFRVCVSANCSMPGIWIVEFEDLDFPDVYDVLECSDRCRGYFHHKCFKSLDKWNMDGRCLTPDCSGNIVRLWENRVLKRESKVPRDNKKTKEKPAPSIMAKKRNKKQKSDSSLKEPKEPREPKERKESKERKDSRASEESAPSPEPPSPQPSCAPSVDQGPGYTGDDLIDMYGMMLIWLEEYPNTHLTSVVMEMNKIYPWVKVDTITEILDFGVQSLEMSKNGELKMRDGSQDEIENKKDSDISLLIKCFKDAPINDLKQKIDASQKPEKNIITEPKKSSPPEKTTERVFKRNQKNSSKPDTKPNKDVTEPKPRNSLSGNLNPGAREFSPDDSPEKSSNDHPKGPPNEQGYIPFASLRPPKHTTCRSRPPEQQHYMPPHLRSTQDNQAFPPMSAPAQAFPAAPFHPPPNTFHPPTSATNTFLPPTAQTFVPQPVPSRPANIHDALYKRAAAQLTGANVSPPLDTTVSVGAPIRPDSASYGERKALVEKIANLEAVLNETQTKYQKELDHYKTQLLDQMDQFSKLKAKAKHYKQDAKIAQDCLADQSKLQTDYDRLLKTVEDERRNWLSERTGKSMESKKIVLELKIKLDEKNKEIDELKSQSINLSRNNEDVSDRVARLESDIFSRDKKLMDLKGDVIDVNKKYKGLQQQHVHERFNTAQLRLRIAFANCEAHIRERSGMPDPELYLLSQWQSCQEDTRRKIDDNNLRYQEYIGSLQRSSELEVRFEEEGACPALETAVPILPLQRYDDILQGRAAPPLPVQGASLGSQVDISELNVLSELMRDPSSFMLPDAAAVPPQTPFFSDSAISAGPAFSNTSLLTASTPSVIAGGAVNNHFQFSDMLGVPSSSVTRPPVSSGGSTRPPSNSSSNRPSSTGSTGPLDLSELMSASAPRSSHFELADIMAGSRQSDTVSSGQTHNLPSVAPTQKPVLPTSRGRGTGRGRARGVNTALGPVGVTSPPTSRPPGISQPSVVPSVSRPPAPVVPQAVPRVNPDKGTALKNRIKEAFPFLNEREIIKYLKRVREDTQGTRVTPAIALQRVGDLVSADYPDPNAGAAQEPVLPRNLCVICHEALNLQQVSRLGCGHEFHKGCLDPWFATQNHTCPTCRSHQPPVDQFPPLS